MAPERVTPHPSGDRQPPAYPAYPGTGVDTARPPRPPLTKRMRPRHWIVIDGLVGVFAAVCDAIAIGRNLDGQPRLLVMALIMVAIFVPIALRRRAPVAAFGGLVILGVVLANMGPVLSAAIFLDATYVQYTVTVESRRRTGAAALALLLAIMVFLIAAGHTGQSAGEAVGQYFPVALLSVLAWVTGASVRQRRRYVVTLQQQAASSAVAEERLRIARELHDVVAHSMSVIAVQAGYGQYVIDTSPDGARDALGAIQATSRDALEEMRRMLGVLRQQDGGPRPESSPLSQSARPVERTEEGGSTTGSRACGGEGENTAPLTPAPGLAALDRLVDRTCGAGLRVALSVSGQVRPVPAGVDLSAFRIIQEALTNVVKHAGTGAACLVSVTYTRDELVICVTDNGRGPAGPATAVLSDPANLAASGTGHGIIGMRERVHLCDGTFSAGPRRDGGFEVTAVLPLPEPDPAAASERLAALLTGITAPSGSVPAATAAE